MKKIIIPVMVFAGVIAAAIFYFDVSGKFSGGDDCIEASGTIETTEILISPKVGGRIISLPFEEGMPVRKGEALVRIDAGELSAQKVSSFSNLLNAQKNFQRISELYSKGSVSRQVYDNALNSYESARGQNMYFDAQLSNSILASPIDSTIIKKYMEPGELAAAGMPVLSVADLNDLWIKIYLTAVEIAKVKLGDECVLEIDGSEKKFKGRIISISAKGEFTPKTIQTKKERVKTVFAVKVKISDGLGVLKPGMPADVRMDKRHD